MAFVFQGKTITSVQPLVSSQESELVVHIERVHQQEVIWDERKLSLSVRSGLSYQSLLNECLSAFKLNMEEQYELVLPGGQVLTETYVIPFEGINSQLILRSIKWKVLFYRELGSIQ